MMATTKRTFKRPGQRILAFRWYLTDVYGAPTGVETGEQFATIHEIEADGAALALLDGGSRNGNYVRVRTKDCAFRFQDPRAPSVVRARESKERRQRREKREKRTEQIHVPLTRTELRAVLVLAQKLDTSVADTIRRAVKELERVTHPPERIAG